MDQGLTSTTAFSVVNVCQDGFFNDLLECSE